ncbi:hypothetical protein [Dyella japonica]|uniref:Uncharacterized protein n=1 Tax=Dyella japonica TaxID=231455 RepID=A0ABV2JQY1_9GAMM
MIEAPGRAAALPPHARLRFSPLGGKCTPFTQPRLEATAPPWVATLPLKAYFCSITNKKLDGRAGEEYYSKAYKIMHVD